MTSDVLAAKDILPSHIQAVLGPLTFNLDTLWTTGFAALFVIGAGIYMRARISRGVPSKLQLAWETLVSQVERQVEESIGPRAPYVVPLAVSLFFFILVANWLEILPIGSITPAPTHDVALTYALAFFVVIWAYADGIRKRGIVDYVKGFFKPMWWLAPFTLIEEIVRPFTLALRLWGNMFGGALMLGLLALLPAYVLWLPQAGWRLFEIFIGLIQAFIFALLTILYFGSAASSEH